MEKSVKTVGYIFHFNLEEKIQEHSKNDALILYLLNTDGGKKS